MFRIFCRKAFLPAAMAVLFICAGPTENASGLDLEGLGGAEIDSHRQGYRYLGAGLRQSIHESWTAVVRITGSGLRYEFDSDGDTLQAHAFAVAPSAGLQYRFGTTTAGLSLGEDFRKTTRERTDDPRETEYDNGIFLQAELDHWFQNLNVLSLISSYAAIDRYVWSRLRFKRQVTNRDFSKPVSWFLGAEGVGSGNVDFKAFQLGGVLEWNYRPLHLTWGLKAGYKHTSTESFLVYGGTEFYISY